MGESLLPALLLLLEILRKNANIMLKPHFVSKCHEKGVGLQALLPQLIVSVPSLGHSIDSVRACFRNLKSFTGPI